MVWLCVLSTSFVWGKMSFTMKAGLAEMVADMTMMMVMVMLIYMLGLEEIDNVICLIFCSERVVWC